MQDAPERAADKAKPPGMAEARAGFSGIEPDEIPAFTDQVMHELKSPLRGIKFCAEVVLEDDGDKLSRESVKMLERIRENSDRLVGFLDALLAFTQVDEDMKHFGQVDLGTVVQRALAGLTSELGATGAVCEVGTLPVIRGRTDALIEVFQKVLENALTFRHADRQPEIAVYAVPSLPTGGGATPAWVDIVVTDNGTGFDNAQSTRIFEPLVRLVGRSEVCGAGLGLAMVHRIIAQHGGSVHAEGMPGQGARITIRLPLDPDAVSAGTV